jgi:hypothetical protein
MDTQLIQKLVFLAGIGHFILALGSLGVPVAMKWTTHLRPVNRLIGQMFWNYAAYILAIHLWFGFVSVFGTTELLNHSFLASSLTLFIGLYWLGRFLVQFFYFDRSSAPKGFWYTLGELALVSLFVTFTIIYFAAFLWNNEWI